MPKRKAAAPNRAFKVADQIQRDLTELIARELKDPRVNSLVDVCNWCSVEFQLPYGLYDAAHVEGTVSLRLGLDGESYPGIRKDAVHVGGRMTLADARGAFGNPTSDSARTMVTTATTSALVVVFAPHEVSMDRLAPVLDITVARMAQFTGCRETGRSVPAS